MKRIALPYVWFVIFAVFAMTALDVRLARCVHEHEFSNLTKQVFSVIRLPGHYGFTIGLVALMILCFKCHWRAAATLLIAGAISSGVTAVIKWCAGRLRPYHGRGAFDWSPFAISPWDTFHTRNLSFPSGDTTLAFASAAVFAVIFPRWRTLGWCWACIVGATRVLQGAHYPSDVAVGAIVGMATADLTLHFSKWHCEVHSR